MWMAPCSFSLENITVSVTTRYQPMRSQPSVKIFPSGFPVGLELSKMTKSKLFLKLT